MTKEEPEMPGVPRYRPTNNAFHPGRYFRTSLSYPQRKLPDKPRPSPHGYPGASLSDSMHRPKVVTVIKNGAKPRNSIRILLNRRTVQSFEQMVADISEAFGSKLKTSKVHKLFTVRGREVQGISDFFRGDEYFVAFSVEEASLSENEIVDILEDIFQDASRAKRLLVDWRKNERRRRKISPENRFVRSNRDNLHVPSEPLVVVPGQDKRDSGFDSGEISTNISEVEQIERLGIVTLRKRNMMDRGVEKEREKRNDAGRLLEERRSHFLKHSKVKHVSKGILTTGSDDIARLKGRRSFLPEIERKRVDEERKDARPLRHSENYSKITGDSGVKESKGGVFDENIENKVERTKTEILEKALDLEVTEPLVKMNDTFPQEVYVQEKDIDERKDTEQIQVSENGRPDIIETVHKKHDIEVVTREMNVIVSHSHIDTNVDNKEVHNSVREMVSEGVTQTANMAVLTVSEHVASHADTKDKNNQKEKRKQEREDQQQRKRAKTRIVRKTRIQRQVSNDDYVFSIYEMGRKLGDGNFAVVRHSRKKETGQEFAVKIIDKAKLKGKNHMVENEIDILKDCCHHNIVRLYEEYETINRIYLVMELVKGGDLFDAITQNVKFGEVESSLMVKDLCHALFYMHSRSIVHRDLKPENLLVHRSKDGSIVLKLADFGLAMEVKQPIYTVCGTPTYVAPEILTDIGYGLEVDMWAVGVITYILLCGFPPFRSPDRNQTELFEYIKAGDFEFISPYWDGTSRSAKDLISHLLVVDRKKRYTAIDVLCHKWVLCGGRVDVVPEGALTVDSAARQTRRELDVQAKLNYESYQRLKEKKKQELERKEE